MRTLVPCLLLTTLGGASAFSLRNYVSTARSSLRRTAVLRAMNADGATGTTATVLRPPVAADWHRARRKAIIEAHPEVRSLLRTHTQDNRLLLALASANLAQLAIALNAHHFGALALVAVALTLGGTLSLIQFTVLHDVIHGAVVREKGLQRKVLWVGSLPSVFGYFLYLRYGHLTHHKNLGTASQAELFGSSREEFEDGDILFVAHRQHLVGDAFPLAVSSKFFEGLWGQGQPLRNMAVYTFSMLFERVNLVINDKVVALTGRNFFFPNKPQAFHDTCRQYAIASGLLQLAVFMVAGWSGLAYLTLAEVAWQLPTHPACAMFVTNHGSAEARDGGDCRPSSSIYIGSGYSWFDWLCGFSNYHVEHHDFPEMPMLALPRLRELAPDFYPGETNLGCWGDALKAAFGQPEVYSCMRDSQVYQDEALSPGGVI